LIDAFNPYIWYQGQDGVPKVNTLNQFLGCLIVPVYTVFSIAALYMVVDTCPIKFPNILIFKKKHQKISLPDIFKPKNQKISTKSIQPENIINTKKNMKNLILIFCAFFLILFMSLFLPHIWVVTFMPLQAWNAYFVTDSPYSLIHGVLLYSSNKIVYSYQNVTTVISLNMTMPNITMPLNTTMPFNMTMGNNTVTTGMYINICVCMCIYLHILYICISEYVNHA
jgi:type IV secretory pathway component VirB8